jgi:hypothetical protein
MSVGSCPSTFMPLLMATHIFRTFPSVAVVEGNGGGGGGSPAIFLPSAVGFEGNAVSVCKETRNYCENQGWKLQLSKNGISLLMMFSLYNKTWSMASMQRIKLVSRFIYTVSKITQHK